MIKVHDNTALVGIAELRREMPKLTRNPEIKRIIILSRGKPVGVWESYEEYEEKEEMIATFEDLVLGSIAREREAKVPKANYLSEKEVAKRFGLDL